MLTYEEIEKEIVRICGGYTSRVMPYKGKYGIGVAYRVENADQDMLGIGHCRKEYRLATFDNVEELIRFIEKVEFAMHIIVEQNANSVKANPKFYRNDKELNPQMIQELKAQEEDEKSKEKKLATYLIHKRKSISSIDSEIENIKKEIEVIQTTVQQLLHSKNSMGSKRIQRMLNSPDNQQMENGAIGKMEENDSDGAHSSQIISEIMHNLIRENRVYGYAEKMIQLEMLKQQRDGLQEQMKFLMQFSKKSFLQRLLTSQSKLKDELQEVGKVKWIQKSKWVLAEEEGKLISVLSSLKNVEDKLELIEGYEELGIHADRKEFLQRAIDDVVRKNAVYKEKDEHRWCYAKELKTVRHSKSSIQKKLLEQCNQNLTEEQKEALIVYNSGLFDIMSQMTAIDGYKQKDGKSIWNQIIESKSPKEMQLMLKKILDYRIFIVDESAHRHKEKLLKILKNVFDDETIEMMSSEEIYYYMYTNNGKKPVELRNREQFSNAMARVIEKLKETMQIIEDIPKDAITLPEDVFVYRGVREFDGMQPEQISRGTIMSTSISMENAKKYIEQGDDTQDVNTQGRIYKILLKKGTPVLVFPERVVNDGHWGHKLSLSMENPGELGFIGEIAVDMSKVTEPVFTEESIETEFKFVDGEFVEKYGYPMSTCEIGSRERIVEPVDIEMER